MSRSSLLRVLLLSWLLCLAGAAAPSELANRTALIVGIGSYGSVDVPKLDGVPHDIASAKAMARAMGIPEQNIRILRDQQATKENILQSLAELGQMTPEGGRSFIYFSGHGTRWTDPQSKTCVEGFLSYDNQTIVNRELAAATKALSDKADKMISILDACHSGGYAGQSASSRSVSGPALAAKFYYKAQGADDPCSKPINMPTRSLLGEVTRLGGLQENFVQITSARSDEVAFDDPEKGGIATQGLRACLLGRAKDLDGSGAVSLEEVRQCAQDFIDQRLKPYKDRRPHHVTITGARNLIPVPTPLEPPALAQPKPPAEAPAQPVEIAPAPVTPAPPSAVISPPPVASPPTTPPALQPAPAPEAPAPVPEPALASLATLRDVAQQRNPRRVVQAKLAKSALKVGRDTLDLSVTSSHEGYVYLVLLGSDAKSFYFLFPNGLDKDNRIHANQTLRLPRAAWQIKAAGPAGTNSLLVMVTDSPRSLGQLQMAPPTASEPFTYALNDAAGRAAVIDYLIGRGVTGGSETFGATILRIREVP